jgi:hypothetical protein
LDSELHEAIQLDCLVLSESCSRIFPVGIVAEKTIGGLVDEEPLSPMHRLSNVFFDVPKKGYLHAIAEGSSISEYP